MNLRSILTALCLVLASAAPVAAQTATQTVGYRVVAWQQAAVQQHAPMTIRPGASVVSAGSYSFASNEANQKISASLDQPMPRGSTLAVTMAAPAGGRSAGDATLGTQAVDVVTAIPPSESSALAMHYSIQATVALRTAERRTVTYSITSAP